MLAKRKSAAVSPLPFHRAPSFARQGPIAANSSIAELPERIWSFPIKFHNKNAAPGYPPGAAGVSFSFG
jgi:hypothetical protein